LLRSLNWAFCSLKKYFFFQCYFFYIICIWKNIQLIFHCRYNLFKNHQQILKKKNIHLATSKDLFVCHEISSILCHFCFHSFFFLLTLIQSWITDKYSYFLFLFKWINLWHFFFNIFHVFRQNKVVFVLSKKQKILFFIYIFSTLINQKTILNWY